MRETLAATIAAAAFACVAGQACAQSPAKEAPVIKAPAASVPAPPTAPASKWKPAKAEPEGQFPNNLYAYSKEPEIVADADSAVLDGFVMDENERDHVGDASRDFVGREFMPSIGASVGRKMPLEFSFDMLDLTGSGRDSLVLWPRIWQLYPKTLEEGVGGPVYVYNSDGKKWHLAAKGIAMLMGTRPQLDKQGKPTGAKDLAFVSDIGYSTYVYDKSKDVFEKAPNTRRAGGTAGAK